MLPIVVLLVPVEFRATVPPEAESPPSAVTAPAEVTLKFVPFI